ncbi:MAG: TIGR00725 family protein [Clostridia bacterium]|nr:TIGR00725 family protein [Clostridia bacterium]
MRKIIAIIGDAKIGNNDTQKYDIAFQTGKNIIDHGYRLQCGGLGGVMEAACKGARSSSKYREGDIIGILPSFDIEERNPYIDIAIPTGIDVYRNVIVANASAVIAIGGGCGTLSEISNAWALRRMILAYNNCGGWAAKVADTRLDERIRYEAIEDDRVYGIATPKEALKLINERVERYTDYHKGIIFIK